MSILDNLDPRERRIRKKWMKVRIFITVFLFLSIFLLFDDGNSKQNEDNICKFVMSVFSLCLAYYFVYRKRNICKRLI